VPGSIRPPPAVGLRPVLRSLASVLIDGDQSAVSVLASWTRLPASPVDLNWCVNSDGSLVHCIIAEWSPCWLRAVLRRVPFDGCAFVLLCDADVRSYCAAVPCARWVHRPHVLLDVGVTPAALPQLLRAVAQSGGPAFVQDNEASVNGSTRSWERRYCSRFEGLVGLPLTAECFRGLESGSLSGLTCLHVMVDCRGITDAAIDDLAGAAPGLKEVGLAGVVALTDSALWVLCTKCRLLARLSLGGLGRGVTAAGLLPLMTTAEGLLHLRLHWEEDGAPGAVLLSLRTLLTDAKFERLWDVGITEGLVLKFSRPTCWHRERVGASQ
jgi:hypothetical protein